MSSTVQLYPVHNRSRSRIPKLRTFLHDGDLPTS